MSNGQRKPGSRLGANSSFCQLVGVEVPIVQTGMGWVAGPRLVAATANAGALGILASATMDVEQLHKSITEVKAKTAQPFGVNLRADAVDVLDRIDLMIEENVKVASFAQAPSRPLIERLQEGAVVVIPSIGAKRHAEKVLDWGVDAVLVQGGEGGGHTGPVPTSILLPQVVDTVAGRVPVIAAGGYYDGRGLISALAYGADAIAMGTRFLLTSDSPVPDTVKEFYLQHGDNDTVVSTHVDGVPHRVLRTALIESLESNRLMHRMWSLPRAFFNAVRFKKLTGLTFGDMWTEGLAMRSSMGIGFAQMLQAANTPMLLKAGLVDGQITGGVFASGQVVGLVEDLPSCKDLIDEVMSQAQCLLAALCEQT